MSRRPLDPQVAALLAGPGKAPRPPGPPVREVADVDLPLPGRTLATRRYAGERDDGVVVFLHGGGFVSGDLDSHDAQARMVCRETGRTVVSVAYRLAPAHPFPAAYDDAVAAVERIRADLGRPVALVGPSAGANLALGAALALTGTPAAPVALLLAYPMVSADPDLPSRTERADAPGLTSELVELVVGAYLPDPALRADPRFAPLLAPDLTGLPPTVLLGAGHDPLRDEARLLADRLRAAGVPLAQLEEPTLPHGFWKLAPLADAAQSAAVRMCRILGDLLDAA